MWGIDRLSAGELGNTRRRLRSSSVALLSHNAATDARGRPVLDALEELGVRPVRLFGPEHGFDGVAQAEVAVESVGATGRARKKKKLRAPRRKTRASTPPPAAESGAEEPAKAATTHEDAEAPEAGPRTDPAEATPSLPRELISLYGADRESLAPRPEHFEGVELLLIDLLDAGARYYTYAWTALLAARAAAEAGVHVLVLDRPNPLSGDPTSIEGTPQTEGYTSFVGLESIPIRHAMTIGELLVHFFARDGHPLGADGAISLVAPRGWERNATAQAWARPFVAPSPNLPTLEAALVYPGGCLVEGTNLSEGRGTTLPFQTVGAPFLDGPALARSLMEARPPGVIARPHVFRPSFEKHAGELCHGVCLHVTQPRLFRPVGTYLRLLSLAHAQAPEAFAFRSEPYEFETDKPAFDLLTGGSSAREALARGASAEELVGLVAPVGAEWTESLLAVESLVAKAHA